MIRARVYGMFDRLSSYHVVADGMADAYRVHGMEVIKTRVESDEDLLRLPEERTEDVGLFIGAPQHAHLVFRHAEHRLNLFFCVVNSTCVHGTQAAAMTLNVRTVTPSSWSKDILQPRCPTPVLVAPHGVGSVFLQEAEYDTYANEFRLLHKTSSGTERKGTDQLILAWETFYGQREDRERNECLLTVEVPDPRLLQWMQNRYGEVERFGVRWRYANSPFGKMPELYRRYTMVIQPSRAEGFGMVPIEALASGIPAVFTYGTGHVEWADRLEYEDAGLSIPVGELMPSDDGPNAMAPEVTVNDILQGLDFAYEQRAEMVAKARRQQKYVAERFQWDVMLNEHVQDVRNILENGER